MCVPTKAGLRTSHLPGWQAPAPLATPSISISPRNYLEKNTLAGDRGSESPHLTTCDAATECSISLSPDTSEPDSRANEFHSPQQCLIPLTLYYATLTPPTLRITVIRERCTSAFCKVRLPLHLCLVLCARGAATQRKHAHAYVHVHDMCMCMHMCMHMLLLIKHDSVSVYQYVRLHDISI